MIKMDKNEKEQLIYKLMEETNSSHEKCDKWLKYMNYDYSKALRTIKSNIHHQIYAEDIITDKPQMIINKEVYNDKNSINDIWMELHIMNIKYDRIIELTEKLLKKL